MAMALRNPKPHPTLMKACLAIAALCLLPLPARAAQEPDATAPFDAAGWRPLFSALSGKRTVFSKFTEQRWFSFRRTPVILSGEMRLDPGRGLSLRYTKPEERLVIVDSAGILLRDARGRERKLPPDPRAEAIERALLSALRFDLGEIEASFLVHGARQGAQWRLSLEPRDAGLAHAMGVLTIEGCGASVSRLEFRRSATQRVVIVIDETHEGVAFGPDELQRYFR